MWNSWPVTTGHSIGTRISEQPVSESDAKHGVAHWYVAECQVAYRVAGHDYSLWAYVAQDSDQAWLKDRTRTCPYETVQVHYNPAKPEEAHVFH
jgi:hypothetical protein